MSASQFPPHHNLFIATPSFIHLYSQSPPTKRLLFECEIPDGISSARAAKDNSCLIAVADNHVVILYDAERGRDKKYRLKSGDVHQSWHQLITYPSNQRLIDLYRVTRACCFFHKALVSSTLRLRLITISKHTRSRPLSFCLPSTRILLRRMSLLFRRVDMYCFRRLPRLRQYISKICDKLAACQYVSFQAMQNHQ